MAGDAVADVRAAALPQEDLEPAQLGRAELERLIVQLELAVALRDPRRALVSREEIAQAARVGGVRLAGLRAPRQSVPTEEHVVGRWRRASRVRRAEAQRVDVGADEP